MDFVKKHLLPNLWLTQALGQPSKQRQKSYKPVRVTGFLLGVALGAGNWNNAAAQNAALPGAASNAASTPSPLPVVTTDSPNSKAPLLDPNLTPYPRSALHSFDKLLDAPAGKYGFLASKGAHFYWPNGKRARFWGINVANTSLQEPEADIDAIIENFRTAGFNLLRLHHFDERGGIIDLDKPHSREFNQAALKKLDYWIYKAKQAGIYIYLDLLDYRRFKEGDGVVNAEAIGRAARPYNVFDPRLIELQKEYAYKLMREHVNPYTGLAYADDPAIVMLEIYDESGLFMRRQVWRTMPEPYNTHFRKMWNDWLKARYTSTARLGAAWTGVSGKTELLPGESLENGTIELPAMVWNENQAPVDQRQYALVARRSDGARFAYEVHIKYLKDMKAYLRSIGVRIPLSATGRFEDLSDLKSLGAEMDFIGTNFYYDHPYWPSTKPAWKPPSYFHNHNPMNDIDNLSMAASISLARVKNRPLVVREWNYCWPNRNRASGIIEAACYAALHDLDAMILFVYETRPTARVSYFNVRSDPSRWGLCGVGAQIFLNYLVQPSLHRIVVPYNDVDVFTYERYHQPFYALGWATRLENDFYDGDVYRVQDSARTDLLVAPGRSGVGRFEGAPSVLHTSNLRYNSSGRVNAQPDYLKEYNLFAKPFSATLSYDGILYDNRETKARDVQIGLPLGRVQAAGYRPIGVNAPFDAASGFLDMQKQRMVFGELKDLEVLRAALDAMQIFYGVPNAHDANAHNVFSTDTGEMMRDAASGRLVVSAKNFQALCGNLGGVGRVLAPGLRVRNLNSGTLVALSLDGKPLVASRHFMIKMVTDARNKDEVAAPDTRISPQTGKVVRVPNQWRIDVLGQGPVTTFGKPSVQPIQISLENRPLMDVYLERGSFELLVNGDSWKFYADTPGTRFVLHNATYMAPRARQSAQDVVSSSALQAPGMANEKALLGAAGATVKTQTVSRSVLQQVMLDGTVRPLTATLLNGKSVWVFPPNAALVQTAQ
jgi:hypothetical protein